MWVLGGDMHMHGCYNVFDQGVLSVMCVDEFLRFIMSCNGISMASSKVQAVL